jgi:FkbM family methyltransferase
MYIFSTLPQIIHNDAVSPLLAFGRYLKWQYCRLFRRFPRIANLTPDSKLLLERPSGVGALVMTFGMYDFNNMTMIRSLLRDDSDLVFFDVGANIGTYTLVAAETGAQVISFEPHPTTFKDLEQNVALNERSNVVLNNSAVADHDGFVTFTNYHEHALNRIDPAGGLEVPCLQLAAVFEQVQPEKAIVKVDVEGAELLVMKGLQGYYDRCSVLIIERGGWFAEDHEFCGDNQFAGPFYFHAEKSAFFTEARRRAEDEVYIHVDYLPELERLGYEVRYAH